MLHKNTSKSNCYLLCTPYSTLSGMDRLDPNTHKQFGRKRSFQAVARIWGCPSWYNNLKINRAFDLCKASRLWLFADAKLTTNGRQQWQLGQILPLGPSCRAFISNLCRNYLFNYEPRNCNHGAIVANHSQWYAMARPDSHINSPNCRCTSRSKKFKKFDTCLNWAAMEPSKFCTYAVNVAHHNELLKICPPIKRQLIFN